jgi:uncharacterized RDD family membrane protein YckC
VARPAPADRAAAEPSEGRFERELVTPEGVDLRVRLGEGGERAAAFLLDACIIVVSLIVVFFVVIAALVGAGGKGATSEVALVVWVLVFFLARNAYFILFELTPRAATPGKRVLGLRVAARSGGRLTADAIFARNAMRELELWLPISLLFGPSSDVDGWLKLLGLVWCSIFVFFPLFNRDRLRVGDLVAGTWVVKAPRRRLMADLAETAAIGRTGFLSRGEFDFTQAQVDAYGAKELHVLEDVLRRVDAKTITAVAARIRGKIGWAREDGESDHAFLDAYYLALRRRLEQRLLFGRRRRDKYDSP